MWRGNRKTQEHSQESSRENRGMGRRWLCHKSQEGAEPFGKLRVNELGPYKDSLEYGDLGDKVSCAKEAASLPHSKGMVYHLMAPQMVNERLND
jgi:hypothetical protein